MPRVIFLALIVMVLPTLAFSQSLDDAIRLAIDPLPTGSRGIGMDGALVASATGYSALNYNPAALAPLESRDLGLSMLNRNHQSSAVFFGNTGDMTQNVTSFSSIGAAAPMPTMRGHLAFGISYDRIRDYNSTYTFKAINPNSSFLNTQGFVDDPHSPLIGQALRDYLDQNNLAWQLHLTRDVADSSQGVLRTIPFGGGLEQSGTVSVNGGLSAFRLGAGIDIAPDVSVGATLSLLFGTYDYVRDYTERDVAGIYNTNQHQLPPLSFQNATISDNLHQDQTGANLKVGLLAYGFDALHFGFTVETPSVIRVNEAFSRTGQATFGTIDSTGGGTYYSNAANAPGPLINNYTVVTPWHAAVGVSTQFLGATLEADVDYADMRQLQFTGADADVSDLNTQAKSDLRSVLNWHLGGEYVLPFLGLSLRAGYGVEKSPYAGDPSTYDTKSYSFGAGILLSKSVLLEGAYRHSTYHTSHSLYNDLIVGSTTQTASSNITDDLVNHNDVSLSLNYRF